MKQRLQKAIGLATAMLMATTVGISASADSSRVFDPSPTALTGPVDPVALASSADGSKLLVVGSDTDSKLYQGSLAGPSMTEVAVPNVYALATDNDEVVDTSVVLGYKSVSVSADGNTILLVDSSGLPYLKVGDGDWEALLLREVSSNSPATFAEITSGEVFSLSGNGNYVFGRISEYDPELQASVSTLWGIATTPSGTWHSFGSTFEDLGGYQLDELAVNEAGTVLVASSGEASYLIELDPANIGTANLQVDLSVIPTDSSDVTAAAISQDGQTIVVLDRFRNFVTVSQNGGDTFAEFDTEIVFGPGFPNYVETENDLILGVDAAVSPDGSKLALLSGEYVGILTLADNTWTTVYAGGETPRALTFLGNSNLAIIADTGAAHVVLKTPVTSINTGIVPVKEENGSVPMPTKMFDSSALLRVRNDGFTQQVVSDGLTPPLVGLADVSRWAKSGDSWGFETIPSYPLSETVPSLLSNGAILPVSDGYLQWSEVGSDSSTINTKLYKVSADVDRVELGVGPDLALNESVFGQLAEYNGLIYATVVEQNIGMTPGFAEPIHIWDPASSYALADSVDVQGSWINLKATNGLLYAASTTEIYSFNGTSWTTVTLPEDAGPIKSFDAGAGRIAIVAGEFDYKGYFSTNGGTTWIEVEPGSAFDRVAVSSDGTQLAFFNQYSVSLSRDSGANFTLIATPAARTDAAAFHKDGSTWRLFFEKDWPGESPSYSKFYDVALLDANIIDWDGSFGSEQDEIEPTWGTSIWDPAAFYTPNFMWLFYDDQTKVCLDGLGAGSGAAECPDLAGLNAFADDVRIDGQVYMAPCADATSTFCIDSLSVSGATGDLVAATLTANAPTTAISWPLQDFAATADLPEFKLPAAGQPSVWEASGANHGGADDLYSVNARLGFEYSKEQGLVISDYSATVLPVSMVTGDQYLDVTASAGSGGVSWTGNDNQCAWNIATICAEKQVYLEGQEVSLSVRLPKTIAGWYRGRVFEPEIEATTMTGDQTQNVVTVTGRPVVDLPIVNDVSVTLAETPLAYRGFALRLLGRGGQLIEDNNSSTVRFINAIKNASTVNDRANDSISTWQFSTLQLQTAAECSGVPEGAILGMVSTDAMAYDGVPPQFVDGSLVYSLAGLHEKQNGQDAVANYSLTLLEEFARCSYGIAEDAQLAPSASVVEKTTGVPKTGIQVDSTTYESAGSSWWRVDVSGITFSNPSVSIDLTGGAVSEGETTTGGTGTGGGTAPVITPISTPPAPVTPPTIAAGETGAVLIGGQLATVSIAPTTLGTSLEIKGEGWELSIAPGTASNAVDASGALVLNPGNTPDVVASGFQPSSKASAFLIPTSTVASLGITQAAIRAMATEISLGEISVDSTGSFVANLDLSEVAAGNYTLQINGAAPNGDIRSISLRAVILDTTLKGWTKKISETQVKVYVKNVVGAGKVQIFVNGREIAWVRATNDQDRKLRKANGFNYLVRTVNLEPGKNRIEIQVDGVRERFTTYTLR